MESKINVATDCECAQSARMQNEKPRYYVDLRNDLYCIVDRETNATVESYESFLVASRIRDEMNGGAK